MVLAARDPVSSLDQAGELLIRARPTAVNLAWAVRRMLRRACELAGTSRTELAAALGEEARTLHREDVESCRQIGRLGAERVPDGPRSSPTANAGARHRRPGTALGVIRPRDAWQKRASCRRNPSYSRGTPDGLGARPGRDRGGGDH
jgi:methylthioribose-1-phosphate isomerase